MAEWKNDEQLFELIEKELYTAVIGDICDLEGKRKNFLSPDIRPLDGPISQRCMAGRAMTVLEVNTFFDKEDDPQPFGLMLEALDDLKKGEIYICAGAGSFATIGELMCTAMIARGARGAVSDSFIRDRGIKELDFPVFSTGFYGQDQRGRGKVIDFRVDIEINGVKIQDGDLIVGDIDGVMVVLREMEEEIITKALEKARGEKIVQEEIRKGMLATTAFKTYGIM